MAPFFHRFDQIVSYIRSELGLKGLLGLFFLSGAAALIYQICWQRLLFAALGSDTDSITIIVSTFMAGLGLGALGGGWVGDRYPGRAITLFCGVEVVIGLFGFMSPWLIDLLAKSNVVTTHSALAVACFVLLVIPTAMMGATLPLLVKHFFGVNHSVGVSVGQLYFANTMGAAMGALGCGFVFFYFVGLHGAIGLAVMINWIVAGFAFVLSRKPKTSISREQNEPAQVRVDLT